MSAAPATGGGGPQVAACFFFHWNILYAEISEGERRQLAERSYEPTLDLLAHHPGITAAIELSGATLEHLVRAHPGVLDKLKGLAARGQVEIVGSTWRSPFLLDVREEHFALHMRTYLKLHREVFGTEPTGLYTHECCADGRLPRLCRDYGYGWFFAWVRHVARHLPERERAAYLEHGFIFPYRFAGDDGQLVDGLPLHGDEIDCMLSASDGVYATDWYCEHLASYAVFCTDRTGFLMPGPSDGEFVHDGQDTPAWFRRVFESHGHIRPEWLGEVWSILERDARLRFTTPTLYFGANTPSETLRLLPGGGFERNDLEHSEKLAEPLQKQLRKLAAQVDLLQAKLRFAAAEGKTTRRLADRIERHAGRMLDLELSDLSRWHPSAETRRDSVAAAKELLAKGRELERQLDRLGPAER